LQKNLDEYSINSNQILSALVAVVCKSLFGNFDFRKMFKLFLDFDGKFKAVLVIFLWLKSLRNKA
jgi:hypothetical protein